MTIRQQGGVFGRNPKFNDVDATNLTVADTFNVNNGLLYTDTENQRVGIGTTGPTFELHLAQNGAGIFVQSTNSQEAEIRLDNTIRSWTQYVDSSGNYNFRDQTGAKTVLQFTTAGNLAVADGNGIDFSATSGAGTSELLDDYEEGTWSMVLSSASGAFTSITYDPNASAFYTKIGRLVTIQGFFRTDAITTGTASGDIYISLPFTAASLPGYGDGSAGVVSFATNWGGDVPCSVSPRGGDTKMNLHYRTTANGNFSNIQVGDLGTGSGANYTVFAAQYISA